VKIGIANDVPSIAEGLRRAVLLRPGTEVVWVARDGAEAVELCAKQTPDLILMDLMMPRMDGVEATRRIMAATPCAILVVTSSVGGNAQRAFEAMGHGALDAIDTPVLGAGDFRANALVLLAMLDKVAKIVASRERTAPTASPTPPAAAVRGDVGLVAIGSSAGGPAALATVLAGLDIAFPAAIVIVQHVDEQFAIGMAEWLNGMSTLPVRVAKDGDQPVPGTVLLASTRDHLTMRPAARLGYRTEPVDYVYRPSIDVFFDSVSRHWHGTTVGVLLTGMGRDGAVGLKTLRDKGCHTIAQDRASSAVYGMPKAAAELGAAIDVLGVDEIARRLTGIFAGKSRAGATR
jgi:two-component system, chemotaxis family, response regulator WspF